MNAGCVAPNAGCVAPIDGIMGHPTARSHACSNFPAPCDFVIHIATLVVGLLIAADLEQTFDRSSVLDKCQIALALIDSR